MGIKASQPKSTSRADEPAADSKRPHRYTARLANEIEEKWQAEWEREGTFNTPNPGDRGFDARRPKYYVLDMFPYPSGTGLHVGHPEGYTATDIVARYKRMRGFNVLHPMGWDAFGLPAEQYAVQTNVHPAITTREAIDTFRRQLKRFGFSYDWSREFATIDPNYYRWTQWIWLKAYHAWYDPWQDKARPIDELIQDLENGRLYVGPSGEIVNPGVEGRIEVLGGEPVGMRKWHELSAEERREFIDDQRLAYQGEQVVNWCPKLGTVLANEEVIDGRSERGGYPVLRLPLRQWMFRITAYAERLLRDLEPLDWPISTKTMQKEWIGRSEGAEIEFELDGVARRSASCGSQVLTEIEELDLTAQYLLEVEDFVPRDPFPEGEADAPDAQWSRRDLPHLDLEHATYFVTWRLAAHPPLTALERAEVFSALLHWDARRCDVHAAVVMPDHVHWIVRPYEGRSLNELCESVKHFSARAVNDRRGRHGALWQPESFDHVIRDQHRHSKFIFYVLLNPVRAGISETVRKYDTVFVGSKVRAPGAASVIDFVDRTFIGMRSTHDAERRATPDSIRVFTTRPDTVFGATYMVLAPEHPLIDEILERDAHAPNQENLRAYVERARNRTDVERQESKEKSGVFTGMYAINPATREPIPVWTADYVLMGYGHGAIMAVPAHDQRDFEFAQKFNLPIVKVVDPPDLTSQVSHPWRDASANSWERAFEGEGTSINSENDETSLDGLTTPEAKDKIIHWLHMTGRGERKVNYKLRDWLFSRQRYWGEPFPIVFDQEGNHYPVDESHLPVRLPELADFKPIESATPQPPLAKATAWVHTTAGEAGVDAALLPPDTPVQRETNTMPNWAGSCWYYLRFCDPANHECFVSEAAEKYWMSSRSGSHSTPASSEASAGVDLYIGGAEHAVLHLLYARFWHKVLFDLGYISTSEPMGRLFHQGLIISHAYQRADGSLVPVDEVEERETGGFVEKATGAPVTQINAKMSKSLKNVVNPDDVIAEYGADTFRLYEMYLGPLEASKPWNTRDIAGPFRFLQRAWRLAIDEDTGEIIRKSRGSDTSDSEPVERALHRTIQKVGDDIDRLAFNTAIAAMMEFVNIATAAGGLTGDQIDRFARVLAPFAPHAAEEIWRRLGHRESIAFAPWPDVDPTMLVDDQVEMAVQINGKVRAKITVPADADEAAAEGLALADARVKDAIAGKTIRKVIVVRGKIINIVVS